MNKFIYVVRYSSDIIVLMRSGIGVDGYIRYKAYTPAQLFLWVRRLLIVYPHAKIVRPVHNVMAARKYNIGHAKKDFDILFPPEAHQLKLL